MTAGNKIAKSTPTDFSYKNFAELPPPSVSNDLRADCGKRIEAKVMVGTSVKVFLFRSLKPSVLRS